jgi:hypothetical protein
MSFAGIIFLHKSCSPAMTNTGNALNVVMRSTQGLPVSRLIESIVTAPEADGPLTSEDAP